MKKLFNLILMLSLTIVVGLSFFSTGTEMSAQILGGTEVDCTDVPPGVQSGPDHVRICGTGSNCPWMKITTPDEATIGKCNLGIEQ